MLSPHQRALILQIDATFMLFDNQFIIKAKTAWEQGMGVDSQRNRGDEKM